MARTNSGTFYQISSLVREAAHKAGGPVSNPIGAGQDLEDAAQGLERIAPTEREADAVGQIIERLRYEGSFAQDYKELARQRGFAARVNSIADRLESLAAR